MSEPIALEKNNLRRRNGCNPSQFYRFTFCAVQHTWVVNRYKRCDQGMIFCYEGMLSKRNALPEFVIENVDNVVSRKCEKFHGFRIALRQLPSMHQYRYPGYHNASFFEIQTSFMHASYFYPAPLDLCINLWMGSESNDLLTYVTDRRNRPLKPVRVWDSNESGSTVLKGAVYGGKEENPDPSRSFRSQIERQFLNLSLLPPIPDIENGEKFNGNGDLQLLYLDFKSRDFAGQYVIHVGPDEGEICNLEAVVLINLVGTCKAAWRQRQLTLRAYGDPNSTTFYSFTIETGMETSQKKGQKDGTGKSETEAPTNMTTAYGELKAGINYNQADTTLDGYNNIIMRGGGTTDSETTANSVSSLMGDALKHTWENTKSSQQVSFSSHTVTTTKKTMFKWKVKVPAGMYLTPMQMKMNCEGESVKIPWIRFVLWKDERERPVEDYPEDDS